MSVKVTIGMPVYNAERFIAEAIDSILSQTFEDFELIISDNASTDRTETICRDHMSKDGRIRYYANSKNYGAAFNYNRVFELSRGKYFKWAAYDDICGREYLTRCVEVLDGDDTVVLCYPKTSIIDEHGMELYKYFDGFDLNEKTAYERFKHYYRLVRNGHECHPVFGLIRSSALKHTRLIGSYISSDLILLGELSLWGKFREVNDWLFFRRNHPETTIRKYRNYRERISWFDPAKSGRLQMSRWRWLGEYLAGIKRAPVGGSEKFLCYGEVAKWVLRNSPELGKDVVKAAAWPMLGRHLDSKLMKE